MARWRRYLYAVADRIDRGSDALRRRLDPGLDPLVVFPYLGFGTAERVWVRARVLEDEGETRSSPEHTALHNLRNAWRRFETDEVPGARLAVEVAGTRHELVADEEGFAEAWLELDEPLPAGREGELPLAWELLEPIPPGQERRRFEGLAVVPPEGARFGVISDVDDTVLRTGATRLSSMLRKVLFGNARTRLPFEGVAGFYRALARGGNPIFYVSSSPWNLYDLLIEFFELNDIPCGPLMLRDWGVSEEGILPTGHRRHKLAQIERVLAAYPELPFVLLGDSGQEDPEIYARVVHDFPEQVLAVYIRDVTEDVTRRKSIAALAREVAAAGSALVLTDDTVAAAEDAAARGLIAPEDVAGVAGAKRADERAPAE